MLTEQADGLWTTDDPTQTFFGLKVGSRATLVRLPSGGLLAYSPIPLTDELRAAVEALGSVEHVVAPNLFHHLSAGSWVEAFGARLHAHPKLGKKRKDLKEFRPLTDGPDPDWGGALDAHYFVGFDLLAETVFFHHASGTMITADLVENFVDVPDHWFTRMYLTVAGISGKPGISRALAAGFNDRKGARKSVDSMLGWEFDRLVMCHGEIIETGASEVIRETFKWLPTS